jgi:enoyl-CoA hydratase/carnithine racemase
MDFKDILLDKKDHIATITMNRPEHMNACSMNMFRELGQALTNIGNDDDIRAVVITGAGDKAFSAGVDINQLQFETLKDSEAWIKDDAAMFRLIESIPQPIISAVNGFAFGYGCKISIVSDLAIASDNAKFGLQGIKLGAVHIITLGRARGVMSRKDLAYLLLSGEVFDAQAAKDMGLVNKVVPQADLLDTAYDLAQRIVEYPTYAVKVIKRMLHRGMDDDYRYEDLLSPSLLLMEDLKLGREAFLNKTKPEFKGY